ncbi:NAD-dependent epimerase/dehydratase family protein [bacterium]|nr:NAD-dependent epimerase/dehydratase family protein [bacterium]
MAYVITGATGHIGNNLVRLLLEKGETVKVIVRKIDESIKDLNVEYIIGSFTNEAILREAINPGDIVIHLAAHLDFHNKNWQVFDEINIKGTKTIAEISYELKARKFIFASSTEAIPKEKTGAIVEPTSLIDISKLKSYYAISKASATNYLMSFKNTHPDFNLAVVYPGCVYGENDYKPSELGNIFVNCLKEKEEFSVNGHYSFVNVKDISNAIYNIARLDKEGHYLLTGTHKTIKELYESINRTLENNKKVHTIPFFLAYLAIPFVKYLTSFSLSVVRENDDYRCDKAKLDLQYSVTDFDEGIKETVSWFREYYL